MYRNDPDAVVREDGSVVFVGPGGILENLETHKARLRHNARMRFKRQIAGLSPNFYTDLHDVNQKG